MAVQHRFFVVVGVILSLGFFTGCGGNSRVSFPPPTGPFTNASLTGPFAYSYTGSDSRGFLAVAGSFQADGSGHITSGLQDVNSGFGIFTNSPVTGTYAVRPDGRGSVNVNTPNGNSVLDFVIVSGGHALITRFDANASGSGTLDQQTTSAFSNTALAGAFAFNVSGIDSVNNPMAMAGNFTSDTTGTITTGIDDSNDNSGIITNDPLSGSIPVGTNGRGLASISTVRGPLTFAFYVVDANHLKLVETAGSFALGGEAFRQTGPFSNASVSGQFSFTLGGADVLSGGPFAGGGVLSADGAGTVTSGTEDFNDAGTVSTNVGFTGNYSIAPTGRGTLTITSGAGTFTFVIYSSSGGAQMLETDIRFVTTGAALQRQTAAFTNASFSGTYGMNFTGATTSGELDSISQFTADGLSKLTGIIDVNNAGGITFGQALSGAFAVAGNGRTTLTLQSPLGTQNLVVYLVDANRALFIEVDSNLVSVGDIRHQ